MMFAWVFLCMRHAVKEMLEAMLEMFAECKILMRKVALCPLLPSEAPHIAIKNQTRAKNRPLRTAGMGHARFGRAHARHITKQVTGFMCVLWIGSDDQTQTNARKHCVFVRWHPE